MRHIDKIRAAVAERVKREGLNVTDEYGCIWPEPFSIDTYENCLAFAYQCKTFNEANKSGADSIKQKAYLDWATWHWYDTRCKGQPFIVWKSRRLVWSWWDRCLCLWDAGLKVSATQIAAKKYEGDSGSKSFVWRIYHIYKNLRADHPEWNLKKPNWDGNEAKYELDTFFLPNGSKFKAINSESDSFQGTGSTRTVSEELPNYQNIERVWGQANFVCQGKPGEIGGHPVAIGNTKANEQWKKLKAKAYRLPDWPEPPPGCDAWETPDGARVIKIHYSADPEKDAAWAAEARIGVPADEWDREMEMNEEIEDGIPVFPDYDDDFHCPLAFRHRRVPIVPGSTYFGGWDCGQSLTPAFVLLQVTPKEKQVHGLLEVTSPGGEPMSKFAPRVQARLLQTFPEIMNRINHVGDSTVTTKSGTDGRTARAEAKKWGFNIKPVPNNWELRRSSGTDVLLRVLEEDMPGFIVDGTLAPTLRLALRGRYKYELKKSEEDQEEQAQVLLKPLKNMYSHIGDAFGYGCAAVLKFINHARGGITRHETVRTAKAPREQGFNPHDDN